MTSPDAPPPQPPVYGQAPYSAPTPPSRGLWFAIGAGSMFLFGVFVALAAFAFYGWVLGDDYYDDVYGEDGYYHVDQSAVLNAVDQPCVAMQDAAEDVVFFGGVDEGVASLKAFSTSIGDVVSAINGASPNSDAKAWRDDLTKVAASVDTFSATLASGKPASFEIPRTAVGPVTERMFGGAEGCQIPMRVAILDPELANNYYGY